ncbi:MAG: endonuclease/exonuclease/phosphatase family protein [Anaerolineales bacterium]|nr:endonuclease/exonuclease/phosphatase family protein [Anaerolineales bacterium]
MKNQLPSWLIILAWIYFGLVYGWFTAYLAFGDSCGLLALANSLAVFLFFPLPFFIILAFFIRRKTFWAGLVCVCGIFIWLWGGLFIPKKSTASAQNTNINQLSVMTYNLLGWHTYTDNQMQVIQNENPDVVFLQELNDAMAEHIHAELTDEYPYFVLSPGENVTGMGVISKYPIYTADATLQGNHWVGDPQIVTLEWQGKPVYLINIHMWPTNSIIPQDVRETSYYRELQAQAISDFMDFMDFMDGEYGVIVAGDTNTTSLSDAYRIITASGFIDSWKEAGFGFGHTFPGSLVPGSSRPVIFGIPSPQWMVRIDFIFHSSHWQASSAQIAPFDRVSDHRAVTAILDWVE